MDGEGIEAAAAWDTLRSAETYLGYQRTFGFASSAALVPDRPRTYSAPPRPRLGQWALSGTWTVRGDHAAAQNAGARLTCRFQARDLHLVATPPESGAEVPIRVLLDGRPPGSDHGVDVDSSGHGTITEPRLYQLVRRQGAVDGSTLEVDFRRAGVGVYAVTFG